MILLTNTFSSSATASMGRSSETCALTHLTHASASFARDRGFRFPFSLCFSSALAKDSRATWAFKYRLSMVASDKESRYELQAMPHGGSGTSCTAIAS
jgi:hypothetical protein